MTSSATERTFAGRTVLVTGGSMGIGRAVARALAGSGARVVVAARGRTAIDETLALLPGTGHRGVRLEVSDEQHWSQALKEIDRNGPLHGLVTAAGVIGPIGALTEVSVSEFRQTLEINLIGTVLALRCCLSRLASSGGAAVTLSGGGATSPLPRYDAYAASKAAVVRLTENVAGPALELGVRINSVAPGFVNTRMHDATLAAGPENVGWEYFEHTRSQVEEGGMPAREAADLVCFLLSESAGGISGKLISAQWDPWRSAEFRTRLAAEPDFATLRRIDDQLFAAKRPEPARRDA